MDQNPQEDLKAIRRYVSAIFFMVLILLLMQMPAMPEGVDFNKLFNTNLFSTDFFKANKNPATSVSGTPLLNYPKDKDEAIALYNNSISTHAATNRNYSYDELVNDNNKVKYLLSKVTINDYAKYLTYGDNKAFAVSISGAYGYSGSGRATAGIAADEALTYCQQYMYKTDKQCYVIDINGVFLGK